MAGVVWIWDGWVDGWIDGSKLSMKARPLFIPILFCSCGWRLAAPRRWWICAALVLVSLMNRLNYFMFQLCFVLYDVSICRGFDLYVKKWCSVYLYYLGTYYHPGYYMVFLVRKSKIVLCKPLVI